MGTRIIRLPDVGEGVAEAELVEWHVAVGDLVSEDQPLAEVTTDKATVEIPSPVAGKVLALGAAVGTMLAVGAELIRLEVAGGAAEAAGPAVVPEAAPDPAPDPVKEVPAPAAPKVAPPVVKAPPPSPPRPVAPPRAAGEKPIASPAVRQKAREAGIDLRRVRGSGPAGRITHDDLDAHLRDDGAAPPVAGRVANTEIEDIRIIGVRRNIARRMAESKRRVAHFTYVEEVDVSALEDLRAALNAGGAKMKLTMLPFLMQAVVRAVAEFPQMNALYDDEAEILHRHGGVHIGIATQTPSGLMVPVVRHAEARDIWDCAAEVKRLADAAREGLATRAELSGSTITITSLGALGGIVSTPVINRPEVAIIGTNKMTIRPVWQDGGFVPRRMMNLSSSFDHRIVDGYDAARFVQRLKALLETPATIFING
jgi:2-oxoisovalerate dehydrogenase E2 component (dihydrolipoyl transacylase)